MVQAPEFELPSFVIFLCVHHLVRASEFEPSIFVCVSTIRPTHLFGKQGLEWLHSPQLPTANLAVFVQRLDKRFWKFAFHLLIRQLRAIIPRLLFDQIASLENQVTFPLGLGQWKSDAINQEEISGAEEIASCLLRFHVGQWRAQTC
jgi:hypothetical protein